MPDELQPRESRAGRTGRNTSGDELAHRLARASPDERGRILEHIESRVRRLARDVALLRAEVDSLVAPGPSH